jgi:glycosyltransferase involved in cell wall biosynthesis
VASPHVLLIYPVRDDFAPNRGILNKMRYQADALRSLGFELTTVVGSERGVIFDETPAVRYRWSGGRPLRIVNHYAGFWGIVAAHCAAGDYDVLYIRHPGTNPALLGFLAWMKSRNPNLRIVLELASYPMSGEADSMEQKLILATDTALSRFLRKLVDYVVTFGDQTEIYGIPCIRSSNGVDVDALPLRRVPTFDPRAPRLLGVASLAKWHGYDRILRGLRQALDRNSDVAPHVSFAGHGPAAIGLEQLCRSLELDEHVSFHGMTTGKALDELFDQSDIAIASLGMHRIGLQNASSLKTREYCARGIPFIFAGRDDSFDDDFPFALRVPVGDDPIDLGQVLHDHAAMLARVDDPAARMRAYATAHLSWKTRLDEIMQVVRG